ncbi:MAG: cell division ATP-binding protein FtsE [Bacteroidota bacterium]
MTGAEPVVSLDYATIFQDGNPVLTDVSFEIGKAEFVFLVGRTGSGKSSLLKTLYADLPLTRGSAMVAGHRLETIRSKEIPLLRRAVGIVFQDFQLLPDRNISENMGFVMRATGWKDSPRMKTRIAEVLMLVGLGASERKMPHQLSGGEQQRAAIARALLNEPKILFADEPTGNLDPEVAADIVRLFQQINKSGTSVLMATHSYGLIRKFPARILKCHEGRLLDSQVDRVDLVSAEE